MFRIKICGITRPADAVAAAQAGADAIGLNFCRNSTRLIDSARAREIVASAPPELVKVGIFADAEPDEIARLVDELNLNIVQLHGRETAADLKKIGSSRPITKALGCGPSGHELALEYLAACKALGVTPAMVLLDAQCSEQMGGTGRVADWRAASAYAIELGVPPLVLAGGLTPDNVADAIRQVRPAAVDTASGVEASPGVKDADKMARFVVAARAAFDAIAS